ncbi:Zn-ribbon domain-containing OB-fold protein [Caballeronia sp. S22]|uniref:Zn-ribbon domain-containing OB-fold protein n=1 Tax=Caballeronia sp. S22 TaxID=3137182 RepID=UPI003530B857
MSRYEKPLPRSDDLDNAPYWAAAREGRLVFQRCTRCGQFRFPAAPVCADCRSREAQWEEISGTWLIESLCRFHKAYWPSFADDVPYTVIQVRHASGVRMYSNPVDAHLEDARIGAKVEPAFEKVTDEVTLVKFRRVLETGDAK